MYRFLYFILFLILPNIFTLQGQNLYQLRSAEFQPRPGGNITTFNIPENLPPVGSNYLNESWMAGVIHPFKGDSIKGYLFRFDIAQNLLEIQTNQSIKVMEGFLLAYFTIYDKENGLEKYFVNASLINPAIHKTDGFFEVIESGEKLSLLAAYEIEVIKANYDPKFDVGNKQDKLIQKRKLFFLKNQQLIPVKNTLKKNKEVFGNYDSIKGYVNKEKLDYTSESDLTGLVRYYNNTN